MPLPSQVYRRLMERLPVRTPRRQIVPMRFNQAQDYIHRSITPDLDAGRPIRRIVLKARRLGMSSWIENFLTCLCVMQDYSQAMVVAHEARATERIWDMSKRFVDGSPLRAIGHITGHKIAFRHSTIELATAGSPNATRGSDLTACHLSEVAFWKDPLAMLAILQCLPREEDVFSAAFIESTANGMVDDGALFYEEWLKAVQGDGSFVPIFLPWHTFPQYTSLSNKPLEDLESDEAQLKKDLGLTWGQLRWRRRVIVDECQDDPEKFNQEYPATPEMAFIMSGTPYFSAKDLIWLEPWVEQGRRGKLVEDRERVRFRQDSEGRYVIFKPPEPGHEYVIGADSAMGHDDASHSRSAAEVVDMDTLEQVAEYEAPSPPHLFARDLALLGRAYNEALLFPEVQSSGGGGGRELIVYLRDTYNYPSIGGWKGANDRIRAYNPVLYGWECLIPQSRILTDDLHWIPAAELVVGQQILGCEEKPSGGGGPQGWRGGVNRLRMQTIRDIQTFEAPRCEVCLADGHSTVVSTTHPFWVKRASLGLWRWIMAQDLRPGDMVRYIPTWDTLRTYEAGRLSGLIDGEGHLSVGHRSYGLQLLVSQAEGLLASEIRDLWKELGFHETFKWLRHKRRPHEKPIAVSGVLRLPDVLRALGSIRPTRLLRRFAERFAAADLTLRGLDTMMITEIRDAGTGMVIGLTTAPDHTLIADGIVGHNTNSRTKPQMIARMREVIDERSALIHSRALLTQLRTFGEKDSGAIEALSGHDDLLMAWGIALMGRFQNHIPQTSQAGVALQFPFDALHLQHQEEIHDRDAAMLSRVMGASVGETLEGMQQPGSFLEW